jgi:hypothetical protein
MSKLNLKLLNSNVAIDSDKPVYTQSRDKFKLVVTTQYIAG